MRLKLTVACALLVAGIVSVSHGLSGGGDFIYYSDQTLQHQVGEWEKDCYGHTTYKYGITNTQYWVFIKECGGAGCPGGSNGEDVTYNGEPVFNGCTSIAVCSPPPLPLGLECVYHPF